MQNIRILRSKTMLRPVILWFWALALVACGESSGNRIYDISGATMGTTWSVRLVADTVPDTLPDQIQSRLDELNTRLSTYIESSEVVRFSRTQTTEWFLISTDTYAVLQEALHIAELTDGAFDVTVAPLVELWGFGASGPTTTVPAQADIQSILENTGHRYLEVRATPMAVRKTKPGIGIDLSAIAKGYAVDQIAATLTINGVTSYMVEIGGEIRTRGVRADGNRWRIAIERPVPGMRAVQRIVELSDGAVATSGDYRNFFEIDGKRYSHTLDPSDGWPVEHDVAAVSIVSDTAMTADAIATAFLVLGLPRALELAEQHNIPALFVVRHGESHREVYSTAFQEYMTNDVY